MCLNLDRKPGDDEPPKPYIAETDLNVFKVLLKTSNGDLVSPYQLRAYDPNKCQHDTIGTPQVAVHIRDEQENYYYWSIIWGLHSCQSELDAETIKMALLAGWGECLRGDYIEIWEAVIPTGSKYYVGNRGDMVSNALQLTNLIRSTLNNSTLEYDYVP